MTLKIKVKVTIVTPYSSWVVYVIQTQSYLFILNFIAALDQRKKKK